MEGVGSQVQCTWGKTDWRAGSLTLYAALKSPKSRGTSALLSGFATVDMHRGAALKHRTVCRALAAEAATPLVQPATAIRPSWRAL